MNFARYVDLASRNAPDRVAVADPDRSLTFEELRAEVDSFANALKSLDVAEDEPVAIYAENSVTFVTAYFGSMKRGAIPFPINMRFSERELRHVFEDTGAVAVVTTPEYAKSMHTVDADSLQHVIVDGDGDGDRDGENGFRSLVADAAETYYAAPRQEDDLADIMYTSGTTGLPKGVKHTHGNIRSNAHAFVQYRNHHRREVALTVTPCFHVAGLYITVTPFLAVGAENRIQRGWDPTAALTAIEEHGITYTFLVPTMLVDLLNVDDRESFDTSTLDVVGTGGSPIAKSQLEAFEDTFGCTVVDGYGLTETTGVSTTTPIDQPRRVGSPGRPALMDIADTIIVDPETNEGCAPDEHGEILISGDVVTPGYLGLPEKEETAFVHRDGVRWLRTGDIGRLDEEGYLFVEDRLDDMIITGGENVYPNEVEEALYALEDVSETAVIATPDERFGEVVTAVIVPTTDDLTADDVRESLRGTLAEYKLPRRIEFVTVLPRSSTRKVDKRALENRYTTDNE